MVADTFDFPSVFSSTLFSSSLPAIAEDQGTVDVYMPINVSELRGRRGWGGSLWMGR
jgi:hypothetical protein